MKHLKTKKTQIHTYTCIPTMNEHEYTNSYMNKYIHEYFTNNNKNQKNSNSHIYMHTYDERTRIHKVIHE